MRNRISAAHPGRLLATGSLLMLGLFVSGVAPVRADPPAHAPAHGYRRKQDDQKDRKSEKVERKWDEKNAKLHRKWDKERAKLERKRDRNEDKRRDTDRDGVPDRRDRFPRDRNRS